MYDISAPDYWAQLAKIRGITKALDGLHEAQVLNLKYWGAIALAHAGAGNWKVEVDFETKTIGYVVKKKCRQPANFANVASALERSVQSMLGNEWAVNVTQNNKVIYRGQRTVVTGNDVNAERLKRIQRSGGYA